MKQHKSLLDVVFTYGPLIILVFLRPRLPRLLDTLPPDISPTESSPVDISPLDISPRNFLPLDISPLVTSQLRRVAASCFITRHRIPEISYHKMKNFHVKIFFLTKSSLKQLESDYRNLICRQIVSLWLVISLSRQCVLVLWCSL